MNCPRHPQPEDREPTDQIEAHPSGGPGTKDPFEIWKYCRLEQGKQVVELFVAFVGKEYKLASQPAPTQ
jgi:hypothetical protein